MINSVGNGQDSRRCVRTMQKSFLQKHEAGYLKRFMRRFDENREDNKKDRPDSPGQNSKERTDFEAAVGGHAPGDPYHARVLVGIAGAPGRSHQTKPRSGLFSQAPV
ncbi:MAG TPA: hypothetical protein VK519_07660 [Pinirhizobacter sp.]|uniref:hypothetical protein n=1 Tax=Pinirhizobacter sp. TaxID=2950432 RepID=UPI002B87C6E0|nr:hypothetical protein [Pinirhizobacter sp.]HMH67780.1 hypothetical protein [Pinirhizobacter sp.]